MTGPYRPQRDLSRMPPEASRPITLAVGIVLVEVIWSLAGFVPLYRVMTSGPGGGPGQAGTVLELLTYFLLWVGVGVAVRQIQGRPILSLVGPPGAALRDMGAVILWTGGIGLALQLWSVMSFSDQVVMTRALGTWALFLPLAAVAVFVQTTAEELYFRGFIQGTLAARFRSPLIWMVLPSAAFGLIHLPNGDGFADTVQIVLYTGTFGLFAADLTARTGTLGAAMGFHFSHNAVLFLVSGSIGNANSGLALWLFPPVPAHDGPVLSVDLAVWLLSLVILWLAARVAVRR